LIDGDGRHESTARVSPAVGVVAGARAQGGEYGSVGRRKTVEVTATDGSARNKMVRCPGMIRAQGSVRNPSAREIRQRKSRHLGGNSHCYRGIVESSHGAAELRQ